MNRRTTTPTDSSAVSPDDGLVLLLDDDPGVVNYVRRVLQDMGDEVRVAHTLSAAREIVASERVELAIVDIELPDGRGTTFVREARASGRVGLIIVLSGLAHDDAVVEGLAAGADDYIAKPVSGTVLRARVDAVRRRHRHEQRLTAGRLTLQIDARVLEGPDGTTTLTRKEADLMQVLLAATPALVQRGVLLKEVWGYDFDPGTSVLDVTLTRVRAKLGFVDRGAQVSSQRERGVQLIAG